MNSLETGGQPEPNRPSGGIQWKQIDPKMCAPEELDTIARCQIASGHEVCLITLKDGALKPRPLDLRGAQGRSEEEVTRLRETFVQAMAKSILVLIEDEQEKNPTE